MSERPVPPSVQLGEVVPPEDPEDWGQPLTWIVAVGMLAAPVAGIVWFAAASPADPLTALPGTSALAAVVTAGAALTGATQRGTWRTIATTVGAGLFAALGLVVVGTVVADGVALGTATFAALAGVIGILPAATLAGLLATADRWRRFVSPALAGGASAVLAVQLMVRL
jgi:MFS family permease